MTSHTIATALICAIAAGCAQAVAHQVAERRHWKPIPRYATGLTIINLAFAPVLAIALPIDLAALLYALLWLIGGAAGLFTWLSYEADRKVHTPLMSEHDLDRLADQIAGEHRE